MQGSVDALELSRSYRANIRKFYAYKALANAYLWLPIWVVYLQRVRGLTLTQIGLMELLFWLVWALAEIPTGSVADNYGRKISLAAGAALHVVGLLLFAVAPTFSLLMAAYVLWALAGTFYSGADQALLYDTLRVLGREGEFTKIVGRASSVGMTSSAVASLLGGFLAARDLALPILATAGLMVVRLIVILTFREPPQERPQGKSWQYWATIRHSLALVLRQPKARYLFLYAAAVPVIPFLLSFIFLQPYALSVGVPVAAFGALVLSVRIASIVGSVLSHRIAPVVGEQRVMFMVPVIYLLALLGLATLGVTGLPLFLVVAVVSGISEPFISMLVNREAPAQLRATTLSVVSLMYRGFVAPSQLIAGRIADVRGFPAMFLALAAGSCGLVIPLLLRWRYRVSGTQPEADSAKLAGESDQTS